MQLSCRSAIFFGQVRSTQELTDFLISANSKTAAVEAGASK